MFEPVALNSELDAAILRPTRYYAGLAVDCPGLLTLFSIPVRELLWRTPHHMKLRLPSHRGYDVLRSSWLPPIRRVYSEA